MSEITIAEGDLAKLMVNGNGAVSRDEVNRLREKKVRAETRQKAWTIKTKADGHAEAARQFTVLKAVTAPSGLRKTKMDLAWSCINTRLAAISTPHWGTVTLTSETDFQYDGRPYVICSSAEQYRCQATMQVMLATMEQSPILLFDGADILDSAGRQGLVGLLREHNITAIIAMTAKQYYAQLVAKMFNAAYWLDKGVVTDLSATPSLSPDHQEPVDQSFETFKSNLHSHDWTHFMSDDGDEVRKGEKNRAALIHRAIAGGDKWLLAVLRG